MKSIKIAIMNKPWTVRLMKNGKYAKKNGDDSLAMTILKKRRIDISREGNTYETIGHELCHAYIYELCIHSAELDTDALEEIFCELMSKRGDELLKLARDTARRLERYK